MGVLRGLADWFQEHKDRKFVKSAVRLVHVVPTFIEGKMRVYDESGEIDELVEPDDFLRMAVGSRMLGRYFKAVRNVDNVTGWEFKPYRGRPIYW